MLARIASGRPFGEHGALGHHRHPVGDGEHEIHVMLDEQQRMLARQVLQQRRHALRFFWSHAGQRLVEQQNLRIARQRHGDLELALLAVRQRAGNARCRAGQADATAVPARLSRSDRFRAMAHAAVAARRVHGLRGEANVLQHRQRAKMLVRWKERPTPSRVSAPGWLAATSRPIELDAPASRR